jgi:DNA-binding MarR family transcriptional regulator
MKQVKLEKRVRVPAPSADFGQALSLQRALGQRRGTLDVADRLHSAAIQLLRHVRKQDAATGEGPARLSALSVLVFGGAKTLGELATAEAVTAPTMSRMVAGLAKNGLIKITADANDRRRIWIRPTAKGKRMLVKARKRRVEYVSAQLLRLTAGDLRTLETGVELLQRLLAGWSENHAK